MGNDTGFVERRFGRYQSTLDLLDFNLQQFKGAGIGTLNPNMEWDFPLDSLDQGDTPHCVGFGMADFGINLPVLTPYTNDAGHKFYYKCKVIDGHPKSEEGTTIRSAAKVLRAEGIIDAYAFAYDLDMIKWWLRNRGPLLVGTIWTSDMMVPDCNNMIYPTGMRMGGHGYIINGTIDDVFRFQNSWGPGWGKNGAAFMKHSDFEKIFRYDGEAVAAVELDKRNIKKPCKLCDAIRNLFS